MHGIYSARPAHNHSCAASTCASQHHYHAKIASRARDSRAPCAPMHTHCDWRRRLPHIGCCCSLACSVAIFESLSRTSCSSFWILISRMSTVSRSSLIFKSFSASSSRTALSVAAVGDGPPAADRLVGAATERGVAFECCDPCSLCASLAAARFAPYLEGREEVVAWVRVAAATGRVCAGALGHLHLQRLQ